MSQLGGLKWVIVIMGFDFCDFQVSSLPAKYELTKEKSYTRSAKIIYNKPL